MSSPKNIYCVFLFLFVFYDKLRAENFSDAYSDKLILLKSGHFVYSFPDQCMEILDKFAHYASKFTFCSIKNARPIRLCENCVDNYVNFYGKYNELRNTEVNGTSCLSIFISQDRLDAVLEYHDHIMTIWDKAHCSDCFDWVDSTPTLSNNTKKFNKMFKDTMDCIKSNTDPNNTEKVCVTCMLLYTKLDEFYKTLSIDSIGVDSVCMDIVDLMNTTRSIWSKQLDCCNLRRSPEIVFLCCTGIISVMPLLFYLAVRYCGPIRDLPNVLKETRFKQSILRSMQRRTN